MDSLDFDDIASALANIGVEYRIHFIGTFGEYEEEDSRDTCYVASPREFSITHSWIEAHEQPFSNMELPRVVLEDPQGALLPDPHSYALSVTDYESLMEKFVMSNAQRVDTDW
jgi:hypothetical protein